jgi:hypothetical protein
MLNSGRLPRFLLVVVAMGTSQAAYGQAGASPPSASPPPPYPSGSPQAVPLPPPETPAPTGASTLGTGGGTPAPGTSPYAPGGGAAGPATPGAGAAVDSAMGMGATAPAVASGLGGGLNAPQGALNMIGDLGPVLTPSQTTIPPTPGRPQPFPPPKFPTPPKPSALSQLAPSVRGMKIAENQSPMPQDRIFYSFNYFSNLNASINQRFQSPVDQVRVYREIWGFEKTFDSGQGSVGLILPLNTLTSNSTIQGSFAKLGGTSTSLGDLSIFTKYVMKYDPKSGSLLSTGLVLTPPTGPNQFAGAKYIQSVHATEIQPFLGYIWRRDNFYLHGFSAIDVPSSVREVTMLYNDVGIGYFLLRRNDPSRFLTAIAPTFETHVNNPLTHRDPFNPKDPTGTPDIVNLTYGVNFEFYKGAVLTFAFVDPVTSPKPFDGEWVLLFNFYFGQSRGARAGMPMIGG